MPAYHQAATAPALRVLGYPAVGSNIVERDGPVRSVKKRETETPNLDS
jgi:hypothetical protein